MILKIELYQLRTKNHPKLPRSAFLDVLIIVFIPGTCLCKSEFLFLKLVIHVLLWSK